MEIIPGMFLVVAVVITVVFSAVGVPLATVGCDGYYPYCLLWKRESGKITSMDVEGETCTVCVRWTTTYYNHQPHRTCSQYESYTCYHATLRYSVDSVGTCSQRMMDISSRTQTKQDFIDFMTRKYPHNETHLVLVSINDASVCNFEYGEIASRATAGIVFCVLAAVALVSVGIAGVMEIKNK